MATKDITIEDKQGNYLVPHTLSKCVHTEDGSTIDVKLSEMETTFAEQIETLETEIGNTLTEKVEVLEAEMVETKKSVSDGKALVATVITQKGVATASDATFAQMASNVTSIQQVTSSDAGKILAGQTIGGVSGTATNDANATASTILTGYTAYKGGIKLTGAMASNGAVTQTLSTNGQSYTVPQGYHNGSGKITTSITNLVATNVLKGKTVGGVVGTATSDATATENDLVEGRTAYVNGVKLTGSGVNHNLYLIISGVNQTAMGGYHSYSEKNRTENKNNEGYLELVSGNSSWWGIFSGNKLDLSQYTKLNVELACTGYSNDYGAPTPKIGFYKDPTTTNSSNRLTIPDIYTECTRGLFSRQTFSLNITNTNTSMHFAFGVLSDGSIYQGTYSIYNVWLSK